MDSLDYRLSRIEVMLPVKSFVYCAITNKDFTIGEDTFPIGELSFDEIRRFLWEHYSRPGVLTTFVYIIYPELMVKIDTPDMIDY